MATKAPAKDEAQVPEKKDPLAPIASGIDSNGLRWEDHDVFGTTYRVREITVPEWDAATDAADLGNDRINPRLRSRLELASSIVSPETTIATMDTWSRAKLLRLLTIYDRVNTLPAADDEGNA